jgi:DcaP outer membrane protein
MQMKRMRELVGWGALGFLLIAGMPTLVRAQTPRPGTSVTATTPPSLEIYGFGQADAIADFKTNNPDWYDTARPSRLPSFDGQYGDNGHFYLSARQSRLGVKATNGEVKGQFEFDMAGVGADAGLTTIRLRHAWGQYRKIGGGQTNTQFMDADVFPNTVEYWGPNGMLFIRNPQVFWEPIAKEDGTNLRLAIEAPGASGDAGVYADRIELQNVKPRFPSPDFTGHYRMARAKGYVQVGGVLRKMSWDDTLKTDPYDLSGSAWGWGLSGSANLKGKADTIRMQFTYGEGIENYFNDAPIDVGLKKNGTNPVTPVTGEALPIFGMVIALDHNWNALWSTAAFYSRVDVTNSDLQSADSYKNGQYFAVNLLNAPVKNVLVGGEFQWLDRQNKSDGYHPNDVRLQFTFKYSFSAKIGG